MLLLSFSGYIVSNFCDPKDCSPPGSPVHGILQARALEWVAVSSSRGPPQPRDRAWVSCITVMFFTIWATREAQMVSCSVGDPGSNPGLGRSPGEANGNPLRSSCPETSMVRGAWWVQHMGSRRAGHDWAVVLSVYVNSSRGPCATAACFPVLPTGTFSTQLWVTSALGPSQALAPSGGLRCSVFSRVPCLLWRQHSSHFTGPV